MNLTPEQFAALKANVPEVTLAKPKATPKPTPTTATRPEDADVTFELRVTDEAANPKDWRYQCRAIRKSGRVSTFIGPRTKIVAFMKSVQKEVRA